MPTFQDLISFAVVVAFSIAVAAVANGADQLVLLWHAGVPQ